MGGGHDPRLDAVEANLVGVFRGEHGNPFFAVHEEDGVVWFVTGSDCPIVNGAITPRAVPFRTARDGAIADRLVEHGRPFLWWTTSASTSPELVQTLTVRGLTAEDPSPAMHTPLSPRELPGHVAGPSGTRVEIQVATNATDLAQAVEAMRLGFDFPPDWSSAFIAALGPPPAGGPTVFTNVLALIDGAVVGAGSVACVDGVAGLYNVSVAPTARNRGVGGAVTRALMRIGLEAGCEEAVLTATPLGLPVYRRLGFETVGEVQRYAWPPV